MTSFLIHGHEYEYGHVNKTACNKNEYAICLSAPEMHGRINIVSMQLFAMSYKNLLAVR